MGYSSLDFFKTIIIVQLFFSVAATTISYSVPTEARHYLDDYLSLSDTMSAKNISDKLQGSLTQQTNLPLIDLGAMLFYTGNILIDLFLNFVFAIPAMISLIISGVMNFFNIDTFFTTQIQIFSFGAFSIFYFLSVVSMIVQIRSGRMIV